jgi:small-conductance mechanosensitive channel
MKDSGVVVRERLGWRFGCARQGWVLVGAAALLVVVAAGAEQASPPAPGPSNPAPSPVPAPVLPLSSDQVAGHLGETVDWFHHLAAGAGQVQITGVDSVTRDKLHQQSLTAVGLAFDFGKACAALLNEQARQVAAADSHAPANSGPSAKSPADTKGFAGRLDAANENVTQKMAVLQSQLDGVKEQLTRARGNERETLLAQQSQAQAALNLAKEVQGSVQAMEDFEASSIVGDNGNLSPLEGQIADMQRSVPELSSARSGVTGVSVGGAATGGAGGRSASSNGGVSTNNTPTGTTASPQAGGTNTFRAESAGVIALVTEWLSLSGKRRQLDDFIKETGDLQAELGKVRGILTDEVRTVVGNDLAISTSTDPTQLLAQRQELEADTVRFKKLSTVLVPLGEQALTVDTVAGTLDDWRTSLTTQMSTVARYLALRIGVVLGWVAVVLIVSEVWRRATFRYLHDLRRRRQFMVLRRVAVGIALTVVAVFGLVSEIGSIATYIGFVTAGVAVALQNVILAVVAYFFFIGRYGVRVGDRVTLAGVTGRVVDIGLVRIYLMELSGPDLHSTGRMVVLSNAVLFQPTAMFKQIPGADYVWHTVTLTIAATADVVEAHKRLKAASDEIYAKYRAAIERQHAVVQRFIDFDASSPQPEIRVRLTENGLECAVRYPVELENAAVIDQRMLKALQEALEDDAQFKLVSSGAVMLKSE